MGSNKHRAKRMLSTFSIESFFKYKLFLKEATLIILKIKPQTILNL
jgi:hypothetical protein